MSDFKEELAARCTEAEQIIEKYLPEEKGCQKTLIQAMNYSVRAGGKRLRPVMMKASAEMFGEPRGTVQPFMAAIEMIHTYSLVHDDLAAMDNDEFRRGKRTTHAVYGEGMGVLAGDGLLNYAFETALRSFDKAVSEAEKECCVNALRVLAEKAGIYGMAGGQAADIESDSLGGNVSGEMLEFIHEHKTAALIQAAMMTGPILQGADGSEVDKISECAWHVGMAFQIQDDILDVTSTSDVLGKTVGKDAKEHKLTYVSMHGLDEAGRQVTLHSDQAVDIIESVGSGSVFMRQLILSLAGRDK
jgi:geranylgeranyl diphosphate synthase type II